MKQTIEKAITERFLQVMNDVTGPGKKYKFKKDFATAMGMRQQELSKVENGTVQLRHLFKIEELTGCNLNWMIAGKGDRYDMKKQTAYNGLEDRIKSLETVIIKYLGK